MSRFLNEELQALAAYVPGEQPRDKTYIKLNTNENPYPPAPSVGLTAEDVADLRLYSDPTCMGLKQALSRLYGVAAEQIFVSNGSDELLNFAFMAFGGRGVVYPDISYGFYRVFADLYRLEREEVPLKEDFSIDPEDYVNRNRMIVIANPNAPTGLKLSVEQIGRILETNRQGIVLIDEAYVDFGGETALPLLERYDNLLVVRTFSKSRSMAGLRLGYGFGSPAVIADLEKLRYSTNPYNVDRLALKLGEQTVAAEAYYRDCCRRIVETRERTAEDLRALGFRVLPSSTNFLFAAHPALEGGALYRQLKERGILVRHFAAPRTAPWVRITVGTDADMARLLQAIRELLP